MCNDNPEWGGSADGRFAYADFVSPEAQALAIGLSERVLEGRKVLIKLGMSSRRR